MFSATGQKIRYVGYCLVGTTLTAVAVGFWLNPLQTALVFVAVLAVWLLLTLSLYRKDLTRSAVMEKYASPNSLFMEVDGMRVHYQIDGTGEPLVLVHGTIGSVDEWSSWATELKSKYRVIRMDIPGFGLTGPNATNRYTWREYVEFLDKFVSKLGLNKFHLGGNSLGGHIAWSYAAAHQDKVQSLLLVGPSGVPPGPRIWSIEFANMPVFSQIMRKCTPKFFFRHALNQAYSNPEMVTNKLVRRHYDLTRHAGNRGALISHFRTVRKEWNTEHLTSITAPTLIMWAKEDKIVDWNLHKEYEKSISNVTIRPYEKVGHMLIKEIPEHSARHADQFLKQHTIATDFKKAA